MRVRKEKRRDFKTFTTRTNTQDNPHGNTTN